MSYAERMDQARTFTCPRCGAVSAHPKDGEQGYCGRCHDWVEDGLASLAPLFIEHAATVDAVVAAITPEDTERALQRILRRHREEG